MAADNPLTDEHLLALNGILAGMPAAKELARKCKDCGLPVDDLLGTLNEQEQMVSKLKRTFFPNEP